MGPKEPMVFMNKPTVPVSRGSMGTHGDYEQTVTVSCGSMGTHGDYEPTVP